MTVFVPGVPRPQPRPRVYARRTVSDSPAVRAWKDAVAWAWRAGGGGLIDEGPVRLCVRLTLPRPRRLMRRKDPDGPAPCDRRPDLDNHVKAVMDALEGVAYRDDGQVAELRADKRYAPKRPGDEGAAGALVTVEPAGDNDCDGAGG